MSIATVTIGSQLDKPQVVTVNQGPRGLPGVIGALESYATHDAADADTDLPAGGLYLLNSGRTVYQKP
jgi:hypothetical protein